uniref:sclerostin n=1 Tax=Scatophagus argus TaxID=75038 RepID=UPI001ED7E518|nr:sclerostin [Scatophagus argus]XP_046233754.1 sclerostin [Scatophagus argus]XP_046233755.1 sclerostin [Scatophagus argus]XP_046233756.1 sclerostin [Scatophagus argus]
MQVSLALLVSSSALLLLHGCCTAVKGWKVLTNDATEILPEYRENSRTPQEAIKQASNGSNDNNNNNNSMNNRAKNGGRTANAVSYSASELSCRELRSTRYITDGSCRSAKPVKELVCSGQCMPAHLMPNFIARGKWWRNNASDYRCIPAHSRTRRVQLQCPNGNTRTYKIRVVTSCKCKRFRPHHNQSEAKEVPKRQRNKKHSRLSQDRSKNNTPLMGNSY